MKLRIILLACFIHVPLFANATDLTQDNGLNFSAETRRLVTLPGNSPWQREGWEWKINPDGQSVAYLEHRSNPDKKAIVHYQDKTAEYDQAENFSFSEDGRRFAFCAKQDGKAFVIVDGKPGPSYDEVSEMALIGKGSPLYKAKSGKDELLILDGKEIVRGERIELSYFYRSEGGRYRVIANDGNVKSGWVTEDRSGQFPGDNLPITYFDGYLVYPDHGQLAVLDYYTGKVVRELNPALAQRNFALSPDAQRVGYTVIQGEQAWAVIDGKAGKKFPFNGIIYRSGDVREPDVSGIVFSPNGKRFAYTIDSNNIDSWVAVVDDKSTRAYDNVLNIAFSPDNRRVAFSAEIPNTNRSSVLVNNGHPSPLQAPWSYFDALTFSPNSKNLAAIIHSNDQKDAYVMLNDRPGARYDHIIGGLRFSPDQKYVGYNALKGNEVWWVAEPVLVPKTAK